MSKNKTEGARVAGGVIGSSDSAEAESGGSTIPVTGQWIDYLSVYMCTKSLLPVWTSYIETHGDEASWKLHQLAMDYYVAAQDSGYNQKVRQQYLREAYQMLFSLVGVAANISNLQSYVRVASEVGEYNNIPATLESLEKMLTAAGAGDVIEPFLPLSSECQSIDPGADIIGWIGGVVSVQLESLQKPGVSNTIVDEADESVADNKSAVLDNKLSELRNSRVGKLAEIIRNVSETLSFTMLEIGALPIEGMDEPFHKILSLFPGSRIIAFEVDQSVCDESNANARPGIEFFPTALGARNETRKFYETVHPMCSSLYPPNEGLLKHYNNLDVSMLKAVHEIKTESLDGFVERTHSGDIDFIKMDIQGAELDVFKGGTRALENIIYIVSEVEFVPLYVNQPLFGDVCAYLAEKDFMFHKFISYGTRGLQPVIINGEANTGSQYLWADAVFVKGLPELSSLSSDQLLKISVLSFLYESGDIAFHCLKEYDQRNDTDTHKQLLQLFV